MRTRSVSPPILSSFAVRNDRPSYWIDATSPRRRATTYGPRRSATCQAFALVGSQGIARRCNVRTSSFQRPSYRGHSRSPSASTSLLYSYPRGENITPVVAKSLPLDGPLSPRAPNRNAPLTPHPLQRYGR